MHKCPSGRNALTEGDPGMMPRDRKDKLPGYEGHLGGWRARVNWEGEWCWFWYGFGKDVFGEHACFARKLRHAEREAATAQKTD